MKQYIRHIIFKELIWFRATSKITEESIKPDKLEVEKDYDNATQNYQDEEEEYDPVPWYADSLKALQIDCFWLLL